MSGGISGFAVGGPAGAIAGGALAGCGYDYAASEYHGSPVRSKKAIQEAIADPTNEKMFNAYIFPVIDAFTGYIGADIYSSIRKAPAISYGSTRKFIVNETKKHFYGPNGELLKKRIIETFIIKNPYTQEAVMSIASQIPKIGAITAIYPYGKQILDHLKKE
uniref:Uncharacterized protein n=1 Tax=Panagrolaimus sp. ES5 TaxID=591445 RepID=A0AC34FBM4_9BILA